MTLPQSYVWIVHRVSNAVFPQKLYAHLVHYMMQIMESVLNAQMSTFVYTLQLVLYLRLTDGAMVKTPPCHLSWIYS